MTALPHSTPTNNKILYSLSDWNLDRQTAHQDSIASYKILISFKKSKIVLYFFIITIKIAHISSFAGHRTQSMNYVI